MNINMQPKTPQITAVLLFSMLALHSCTVAKIGGKGPVPIMLNQPAEKMELMEHISVKKNINFDYTGYTDVANLLSGVVSEKKPDAVINTTISFKAGIDNYFLNLFTLGLAQSRKVMIEADFVKKPVAGN
jgi:hypothetical protein